MKAANRVISILACVLTLALAGCSDLSVSQSEVSVVSESEPSAVSTSAATTPATTTTAPSSESAESAQAPHEEKQPESSEPKYAAFFRESRVHELNIEIDPSEWAEMVNDPKTKTPRKVNITIDGVAVKDAGIHPRGGSSLEFGVTYKTRLPYKIKFDEFVDGGNFLGLDEIALENSACDPSTLRQYVGMEAMRAVGVDAPYVTFFNVSVNGQLHGFYSGIEAVDSSYLERVFGSHKHSLYKAEANATLTPYMSMEAFEQKKGSDESKSDLKTLIEILDETPLGEKGRIEEIIDVDLVLKTLAADAVIHNWDNYAGETCHNFYLYMDGGLFRIIPWDMNETFLQTESGERPGAGSKQDILSPITGYVSEESRPLVQKLMAVDEYYEKYIGYCEQCSNWLFDFSQTKLRDMQALVSEHYTNDPTKFYKLSRFQQEFDETNRDGISGFIKERCEYLSVRIPEIRAEKGLAGSEDE